MRRIIFPMFSDALHVIDTLFQLYIYHILALLKTIALFFILNAIDNNNNNKQQQQQLTFTIGFKRFL